MITAVQSFKLYELFLPLAKSEDQAKEIVTNIEQVIDNKFQNEKDTLASKNDIFDVKSEIQELKIEMKEQKSEIIKWMFLFWIGQIAVTLALVYLKK